MKPSRLAMLTELEILALDNALDSFNCRGIYCDMCPLKLDEPARFVTKDINITSDSTQCAKVYVAGLALIVKIANNEYLN